MGDSAIKLDERDKADDEEVMRHMIQSGLRNHFYRDSFRKAWGAIYALSGLLAVSLIFNVLQYTSRPEPLPIAVDPMGRVFNVTPLDETVLDGDGIRQWAGRTIPTLYHLDFRNYREQLASLEPVFTPAGYKGYLDAVARFKLIDDIKENNYIVGAAPRSAPQVVADGMLEGRRYWKVRAPIVVTFDNGSAPAVQNLMVTAFVVRVPETKNPFGLSIHSFTATRG